MFKLDVTFNGKSVRPAQLGNELAKAMKSQLLRAATETVRNVRCPVHGMHPRDIRVQRQGRQLQFEYEACCERLTEAVETSLQ